MHLTNPPMTRANVEDTHPLTASHLERLNEVLSDLNSTLVNMRGLTGAYPVIRRLGDAVDDVEGAIRALEDILNEGS